MFQAMKVFDQWRDRAQMLTPPLPWDRPHWRDRSGPLVVLLHGLWRGKRAMDPLARAMDHDGFSTLNLPYPSARMPLSELVNLVRTQVAEFAGDQPVHFITHSLGGILARALLADPVPWVTGKIVMLAPPNGGSEIVDWVRAHPPLDRLLGPTGCSLGSDGVCSELPALPPEIETAVIMGNRQTIPFFKNLLDPENDGIVSAAKGSLDGLRGFTVIDADHTFMPMHPEAIRLTLQFLKTGEWPD